MNLLNNPKVLEKIRKFNRNIDKTGNVGTMPRGFFLNYSNVCNFNCQQCFTESPSNPVKGKLTLDNIKDLADQADELGMFEVVIEGGEPLVIPELFDIIRAFGADRFYMGITTNGYLLDMNMANRLAEAGVSRVVVSLDSMKAEIHDDYRGKAGAYEHAIAALENVKKAGMQPSVNFLVGHYNAQTGEVEEMCEFCKEKGYQVGLIIATPTGNWRGKYEVMLDESDSRRLEELRKKYRNIWRDIWPQVDKTNEKISGCLAVNRPYINPYGEVLPCSYLHMSIGNILEKPLKEILEYGFSINYFSKYHCKCYVGEDIEFARKYLDCDMSIMKPLPADQVFGKEDFKK